MSSPVVAIGTLLLRGRFEVRPTDDGVQIKFIENIGFRSVEDISIVHAPDATKLDETHQALLVKLLPRALAQKLLDTTAMPAGVEEFTDGNEGGSSGTGGLN